MTSLKAAAKAAANGHASGALGGVRSQIPVRDRRPGLAALAVVLMVGLGLAGAYIYSHAGQKQPVVMVVRDVPAGHPIQRADLTTVDVAGSVTAIGKANMASVIGQTAVVELLPNTFLQRAMVTSAPPLGGDQAQVGVAVKPGQIPADGLSPGDTVEVVELPVKDAAVPAGGQAARGTILAAAATVYSSVSDPSQSGGTLLTLVVAKSVAVEIASASSAGLIALVRVSR